jgi:hypothetical protein
LRELEPESSASANSATSAHGSTKPFFQTGATEVND